MTVRRARGQSLTILGDLSQRTADAGVSSLGRRARRGGRERPRRQRAARSATASRATSCARRRAAARQGAPAPRGVRDAPFAARSRSTTDDLGAVGGADRRAVRRGGRQRRRRRAARAHGRGARGARRTSSTPTGGAPLGAGVNLIDLHVAKGLEFDAVVVVEPEAILRERPDGGVGGLYTALTRSTRALAIVHARAAAGAPAARECVADRN